MTAKAEEGHLIASVEPGSIADELGIEAGDRLLAVNGQEIADVFEYRYLLVDEEITVLVEKPDGEEWEFDIEKEEHEDLGIEFTDALMDEYRSCRNKCVFCFIDQLPRGMRQNLYFKDDDARLSFLHGNYITLTNMSEEDFRRVILYRLSPINISVQATNPELRCRMLSNRFAGGLMDRIRDLAEADIEMNTQIVLCKGYNDGEELDRSIRDLAAYIPQLRSLSVVPVGITKFRDEPERKLPKLDPFTKEEARKVLDQIHGWQKIFLEKYGTRFVFASDEWYIRAEEELPPAEYYEDYQQYENGVGMMRDFIDDVENYLVGLEGDDRKAKVTMATGVLASPFMQALADEVSMKFPGITVQVKTIINNYFGPHITVAGLLTGTDILDQLKDVDLGDRLLLPATLVQDGEGVRLLDDITVDEISETLQIPVRIVKSDGMSFVENIIS